MTNEQYLENLCEELDAVVFSSDFLHSQFTRDMLKKYLKRWAHNIPEVLEDHE